MLIEFDPKNMEIYKLIHCVLCRFLVALDEKDVFSVKTAKNI